MRIALVSREIAGVRGGGIGTYVLEAGHALRAAGHRVTLVTEPVDDAPDRARLERGGSFDAVCYTAPPAERRVCGDAVLGFAEAACDVLENASEPFDYAEFPDFGAAGHVAVLRQRRLGALPRTRLGVALHAPTRECLWSNSQEHLATVEERIVAALEDETLRCAPLIWSPSLRLRELVAKRLDIDPGRIPILRYPMRFPSAAPPPPAPRAALRALRFAFFGRIEARKGVPALVEAFRRLPELHLDLFGRDTPTSPRGTSLRDWLARDLPANVRLHEALPRAALIDRLAETDVCLLPSPWENWPNACLEAMGAARVVVGGRDGGMGEMIEAGRSGFLVDGRDPADIVRVVREELGAALDRLDAIGAAARQRALDLSAADHFAARLSEIVAAAPLPGEPSARTPDKLTVAIPWAGEHAGLLRRSVRSVVQCADAAGTAVDCLVVSRGDARVPPDCAAEQLTTRRPGNAGLRGAALEAGAARSPLVTLLAPGDRLLPGYVDAVTRAAAREPRAAAFAVDAAIRGAAPRAPRRANPLPFDPALVLLREPSLGTPLCYRTAFVAEHGLKADPFLEYFVDHALLLDLVRAGGSWAVLPARLALIDARAPSRSTEPRWQPLLAELAHLAAAHPPPALDPPAAHVVAALVRGYGAGAALAPLGARPWALIDSEPGETPTRLVVAAFTVVSRLGRLPLVGTLLRAGLRCAFRAHGRLKD